MVRFDDSDAPFILTPKDAWNYQRGCPEFNSTVLVTSRAGAQLTFNFTGTGVGLYGTISNVPSDKAVSNRFTLDGGDPVTWSQEPRATAVYDTPMFVRRGLEDGMHMLVMVATVEKSHTWIDYVEVDPGETPSSSTFSSTQSNLSASISSDVPGQTSTASVKYSISPGAAVGIAVGSTVGLCLMLLLIAWGLRRRWRRAKEGRAEAESGWKTSQTSSGSLVTRTSASVKYPSSSIADSPGPINTSTDPTIQPYPLYANNMETPRKDVTRPSQSVTASGSDSQATTTHRRSDLPPSYIAP